METSGPCPFCGRDAGKMYHGGSRPLPKVQVECGWCGSRGPFGYGNGPADVDGAISEAVDKWNRREGRRGTQD